MTGPDDTLDPSESTDSDELRNDDGDIVVDPPDDWSEADKFGMTAREEREGESLDARLAPRAEVTGRRRLRQRASGSKTSRRASTEVRWTEPPRMGVRFSPSSTSDQGSLFQPATPMAIIRNCLTAIRWISSSASALCASSMASADDDHRVDEQARQHVEVLGAPLVQPREARQVGGQLGGDQPDLGADRVTQHRHAAWSVRGR